MIQRTFFDLPIARKSDPATSHAAAALTLAKLPQRQAECLELIRKRPGICGSELEAIDFQLRKRLTELERARRIRCVGVRKSAVSGHESKCWEVV